MLVDVSISLEDRDPVVDSSADTLVLFTLFPPSASLSDRNLRKFLFPRLKRFSKIEVTRDTYSLVGLTICLTDRIE